ncbi:DUF6542 domain-containing protein [Blastococcus sp. SYSU D00820]
MPPLPPLPPLNRPAGQGRPAERRGTPERPAAQRPPLPRHERGPADYGRPAGANRSRPPAARGPEQPRARRHEGDDEGIFFSEEQQPVRRERIAPAPERGSKLRGILAVLGVFVVTLGAAYVDSLGTPGLGTITLAGLVGSTALATLLVRRRDLATMIVAPPLVFIAVVLVYVGMAPGVELSLRSLGTAAVAPLVRGFPTMAIATGTALVLAIIRWAARK